MDLDKTQNKLFAKKNNVHLIQANKGSSEGACQEGGLPGRPCVGPDTATGTGAASTNQLGLGQEDGMYEPHWVV